jgi:hypothetical protein
VLAVEWFQGTNENRQHFIRKLMARSEKKN